MRGVDELNEFEDKGETKEETLIIHSSQEHCRSLSDSNHHPLPQSTLIITTNKMRDVCTFSAQQASHMTYDVRNFTTKTPSESQTLVRDPLGWPLQAESLTNSGLDWYDRPLVCAL